MGEYTVLDGSDAFALPTKFGQHLEAENNMSQAIYWKSYDADGKLWLDVSIPLKQIVNTRTEEKPETETAMLVKVLSAAHNANKEILQTGYNVVTKLTFPRKWGLGTSSTLIALVAKWFGIDAYALLSATFGGSGYDIACAQYNTPLIYNLKAEIPKVTPVHFNPDFTDKLYFVYLNQKQNSREAIAAYRKRDYDKEILVHHIDRLINQLIQARDLISFASALEKQEALMAGILGIATVQEKLFPDFNGVVKSLGAWGGDFILAVSEENPEAYFTEKGFKTILPYHKMVL
ncbi:GYDIA family GHMP kinase [Flavobacterium rhizosphaerae]|uniref:GYDIA family GHMP kinase n=1 Tax=Flavobacterium rhizosphaerae TaxID=3163298 RepID=A0ABW8YSG0_9FLAO